MDAALRSAWQGSGIPNIPFVSLYRSEESRAWMLRFAQHDKSGKRGCFTALTLRSA